MTADPGHSSVDTRRRRWLRIARPAALVCAAIAAGSCFARPVVVDDVNRLQTVADPQISPDGAWVVYTVSRVDQEADADNDDLWLGSWDGTRSVQLTYTPSNEHSPRWSPDGGHIAFLSDRNGQSEGDQIWILDRRGGEARQRTDFKGGISGFAWSPDGARLAFTAEPPEDEKNNDEDADKPVPIVLDRLQFKLDETGYLRSTRTQLYLLDAASGSVTALTEGPYDNIQPAWSPDGRQIAFLSKRGDEPDLHNNWDVYLIDARAGAEARQLTTSPGMEGDPTWEWGNGTPRFSPDGTQVAFLAGGAPEDVWYGLVQVGAIDVRGGEVAKPTTALDRNTVDPRWSSDGKWIYFRLEDNLSMQLARVRVSDARVERLTPAGGVVTQFDVGPRGRLAVIHGTTARPGELAAVEDGKLRYLSHHNDAWLNELDLVEARELAFKSADGLAVHGLLMTPPGDPPAGGHPALLRLHGGPVAQHQHEFDFAWQLFVANGYAVVAPNPRGSSGRGYGYQRMLFAEWGYVDVPDVLAAMDHVVAEGIADPKRLGVGGWSYGAILTNYVIATDQRFAAAISGAGMSNMLSGYGVDHYVREWEQELGLPWENTERWTRLSYPFLHANRIVTPTLFLCGADDLNVPLVGSEQMYQALRRLGIPTRLVVYPGQYHSFSRPSFRADRLRRYLDWYGQYLTPGS